MHLLGVSHDGPMWAAVVASTWIVFVAELGDRSQLMAMTLATRVRPWRVLGAIAIAAAAVHVLSVGLGGILGAAVSPRVANLIAGVIFVVFGIWALRGEGEDDEEGAERPELGLWSIAGAFFIAELGDKTMIATATFAATANLFGTWVGSTVGMVAADALAIVVGAHLRDRVPTRWIEIFSAIAFVIFGLLFLRSALWP